MALPDTHGEEFLRFYKISREGRWHRKSSRGSYEEMKNRSIRHLRVLAAKSLKRIE